MDGCEVLNLVLKILLLNFKTNERWYLITTYHLSDSNRNVLAGQRLLPQASAVQNTMGHLCFIVTLDKGPHIF